MTDKFIPAKVSLKITTYEKVAPDTYSETVTHVFHGDTIEYAHAVMRAHAETDKFFSASLSKSGILLFHGKRIELKNSEPEVIKI